jgi:hypothetical protein
MWDGGGRQDAVGLATQALPNRGEVPAPAHKREKHDDRAHRGKGKPVGGEHYKKYVNL